MKTIIFFIFAFTVYSNKFNSQSISYESIAIKNPILKYSGPINKADIVSRKFKMSTQTYTDFSWTVWHEGVRLYDDGLPGHFRDINAIRTDAVAKQTGNQGATNRINGASNDELMSYLPLINSDALSKIKNEGHFVWVAYHEGLKQNFRTWLAQLNFGSIRGAYFGREQHNPNARNLLAALSNQQIADLINSL